MIPTILLPLRLYIKKRLFFSGCDKVRYRSTVEADELDKFRRVGSDWWEESSLQGTGPLHAMNPVRVSFIREQLLRSTLINKADSGVSGMMRDLRILDVGCGGGILSESLARLGAQVTGIDPSPENIAVARAHASRDPQTRNINYMASTIEEMAASGARFDAVCSLEVLEHVNYPQLFIDCCNECLNPGGSLFLSTINRTGKSFMLGIVAAEHLLRMVPVGTHEWRKFISPTELRMMVERPRGGDLILLQRMSGMVLRPHFFSQKSGSSGSSSLSSIDIHQVKVLHWELSDDDLDVNYIIHAVKNKDKDGNRS